MCGEKMKMAAHCLEAFFFGSDRSSAQCSESGNPDSSSMGDKDSGGTFGTFLAILELGSALRVEGSRS